MGEFGLLTKCRLIITVIFSLLLIQTCQGFPISVKNGTLMTSEMLTGYVQMFFMPVDTSTPAEVNELNFHVNMPLLREDTPHSIFEQVQPYNFLSMPLTLTHMDPDLISLETSLMSGLSHFSPNVDLLKMMMEKVFDKPRNKLTHASNREMVGGYIYEKLGRTGLIVTMQDFAHELPLKEYAKVYYGETVAEITELGTNVIGILPGKYWQTMEDKPILIGAHWDSVSNTTGFDDNGSGVAVMLEVARVLANSKVSAGGKSCLVPDHTVLFVAFDSEEPGSFGSIQFIRKFLGPRFLKKGNQIQGAFILDTILNVNLDENSQDVPDEWLNLVPDAAKDIKADNSRGNFMAVMGRSHPQERILSQTFNKWWKFSRQKNSALRTVDFELKKLPFDRDPLPQELLDHSYFWLSDHSRFWYYRETDDDKYTYMPALLLTDTAFHRGYMKDCYHNGCDVNSENISQINYEFLEKTTQALIWTIAELAMDDKETLNECIVNKVSGDDVTVTKTIAVEETQRPTTTTTTTSKTGKPTMSENEEEVFYDSDEEIENTIEEKSSKVSSKKKTHSKPNKHNKTKFIEKAKEDESSEEEDGNELVGCQENHCHQDESDEMDEDETENDIFGALSSPSRHPAFKTSLTDRMNFVRGPQINIENLHLDLSTKHILMAPEKQDRIRKKHGPDILLGSGSVDPAILARVIESFYGGSDSEESGNDRRRYKGKHQTSTTATTATTTATATTSRSRKIEEGNSPMYIRLKAKK